eukprot:95560_1
MAGSLTECIQIPFESSSHLKDSHLNSNNNVSDKDMRNEISKCYQQSIELPYCKNDNNPNGNELFYNETDMFNMNNSITNLHNYDNDNILIKEIEHLRHTLTNQHAENNNMRLKST